MKMKNNQDLAETNHPFDEAELEHLQRVYKDGGEEALNQVLVEMNKETLAMIAKALLSRTQSGG